MAIISNDIAQAISYLNKNEVIGIPTETVYGLAGNALNPDVILSIFKIKKRPAFDPLILHCSSIDQVKKMITTFPQEAYDFAQNNWPGSVTLILEKDSCVPDLATSGLDTVAVRIPDHPLTLNLLDQLDYPLAAPSANPFGYISPTTPEHVNNQLGEQVSFILDGGPSKKGIESSIVDFTGQCPVVLRMGALSLEELETQLGHVEIKLSSGSNPKAPGMIDSHYAPKKPVLIGDLKALIREHTGINLGVLSWSQEINSPNIISNLVMSRNENLDEAASNLFAHLRRLDDSKIDIILTEYVPELGIGRAINDRLRRAAKDTLK